MIVATVENEVGEKYCPIGDGCTISHYESIFIIKGYFEVEEQEEEDKK